MDVDKIRDRTLELLQKRNNQPLTATEIAEALRLQGKTRKKLQKWLHQFVVEGNLALIRKNRYAMPAPADLCTGTLRGLRSGNGLLIPADGGATVLVREPDLGTALPEDRVLVRLWPQEAGKEGRPAGKVIRVIERSRRDIVGTLKSTGRFMYVVPLSPSYRQDFYVSDAGEASVGDRVMIRFTDWPNRHVSPEAEIVETLGPAGSPSVDTLSIVRHYGLPEEFPAEVVSEAETVSARASRPGRRRDCRGIFTLTVDPASARDFDDALSLEKDNQGRRVVGVHIADVSHFVRPGSALDKEAARRGNSVYLPDKVLPMLPEQLSNGVCSLRPDEDRLAFSAFLTIDDTGRVVARDFARTRIRSRLRLTYEQAMAALNGEPLPDSAPDGAGELLKNLDDLAQQFRRHRFERHALDLEMKECRVQLAPDGTVSAVVPVPNDRSHHLVEECMVAANEAVAVALSERKVPLISRLHEPPVEESLEELSAQLAAMGFKPGNLREPANLSRFVSSVKDNPLAYHINLAVLKSMQRALYSASDTGHYGLAKKFYAHFTSPIRRYPDLVVHRQLASLLAQDRAEPGSGGTGAARRRYKREDLAAIAENCTLTERTAEEAERALVEIMKYRFLENELLSKEKPVHEAVVVNVTNFGMFMELMDIQIQGLVHVSAISDRFVRFSSNDSSLRAGKTVYRVGTQLPVRVVNVDIDKRRIDFALA